MDGAILILLLLFAMKGKGSPSSGTSSGGTSSGEFVESERGRVRGWPYTIDYMAGGGYRVEYVTPEGEAERLFQSDETDAAILAAFNAAKAWVQETLIGQGDAPDGTAWPWPHIPEG